MAPEGKPSKRRGERSGLERQRRRLARWLAEWQLDVALGDPAAGGREGAQASAVRRPPAGSWHGVAAGDRPVAAGQVRLFMPAAGTVAAARPLFFAVLEAEPAAHWLIAPFGRFAEPGLPGEWQTARKAPALRVLCLWNARALPGHAMAQSWWVDDLTDGEQRAAREVRAHLVANQPLTEELARAIGPPLMHPDDPRGIYRYREMAAMDALVQELAARYQIPEESVDLLRAAESHPEYNSPPKLPPADSNPSDPDRSSLA